MPRQQSFHSSILLPLVIFLCSHGVKLRTDPLYGPFYWTCEELSSIILPPGFEINKIRTSTPPEAPGKGRKATTYDGIAKDGLEIHAKMATLNAGARKKFKALKTARDLRERMR